MCILTKCWTIKYPKILGFLTARRVFNKSTILSFFLHSFTHISFYCIHVRGSAYETRLRKLNILQERVIRIISGVPSRSHTDPLFSDINILKFNNPYRNYVARFMYKLTLGKLPNIFPMFVLNSRVHEHGTRQAHYPHLPLCRTILIKMSLSFRGPQIWNELVSNFDADYVVTFKNRVKWTSSNICIL